MRLSYLMKRYSRDEIKTMLNLWIGRRGDYCCSLEYDVDFDTETIYEITNFWEDDREERRMLTNTEARGVLYKAYAWWRRQERAWERAKRRGFESPHVFDYAKTARQYIDKHRR